MPRIKKTKKTILPVPEKSSGQKLIDQAERVAAGLSPIPPIMNDEKLAWYDTKPWTGKDVRATKKGHVACSSCDGYGRNLITTCLVPKDYKIDQKCTHCNGTGWISTVSPQEESPYGDIRNCSSCDALWAKRSDKNCNHCGGNDTDRKTWVEKYAEQTKSDAEKRFDIRKKQGFISPSTEYDPKPEIPSTEPPKPLPTIQLYSTLDIVALVVTRCCGSCHYEWENRTERKCTRCGATGWIEKWGTYPRHIKHKLAAYMNEAIPNKVSRRCSCCNEMWENQKDQACTHCGGRDNIVVNQNPSTEPTKPSTDTPKPYYPQWTPETPEELERGRKLRNKQDPLILGDYGAGTAKKVRASRRDSRTKKNPIPRDFICIVAAFYLALFGIIAAMATKHHETIQTIKHRTMQLEDQLVEKYEHRTMQLEDQLEEKYEHLRQRP